MFHLNFQQILSYYQKNAQANLTKVTDLAEVVEDAVTMFLVHARVNVEAGVAEIRDFLCQEFDTLKKTFLLIFEKKKSVQNLYHSKDYFLRKNMIYNMIYL